MTGSNLLARSGATPTKLAAVCVLAVVLVAVLWHNVTGSTKPVAKRPRPTTTVQAKATTASVPKPEPKQVHRQWPKLSLDNVVKNDPFAMPTWYVLAQSNEEGTPESALARSAKVLEELKKQQTKIIVITEEDRIATIGEQSFRVGDMIEGFQVTAITTDGIVLTDLSR